MSTVDAIYKDGVFRPVERVELPEDCRVRFQVEPVESVAADSQGMQSIYEIMSRRFRSGRSDLAERHNEHQP